MKFSRVFCLSAVLFTANAQGASYSTNFNAYNDQLDVAGQGGWQINDNAYGISGIVGLNSSNAAEIGGAYYDRSLSPLNPGTQTVQLTHAYGGAIGITTVSFDFTFRDSTNAYNSRDTFGISLMNGTSNVFSVLFTPLNQSLTPDDPLGPDAQWNLSYRVGDVLETVSLTQGVLEGGLYSLNLQFTPNGASTDFSLSVAGDTTEVRSGTLGLNPSTVATDFGMAWTPTNGAANAGDNFFVLDNLNVMVPEASVPMFLCLAGLGMISRRRRAR